MSDFMKRLTQFPTQFFLILIGGLLFLPMLGVVPLFDWDEINFAESAREMLVSGNFRQVQINFEPFYEKPPLFMWLQALCMQYYGVNEFAARLPNAVFGILTMLLVFNVGRRYFSSVFGFFWALLMACSFLPFFYFKSGIIDPVFNYFICLSLFWLFRISVRDEFESFKTGQKRLKTYTFLSAVACGLAVITKGPVAILVIVLTVLTVLWWNRGRIAFTLSSFIIWSLVVAGITTLWLSYELQGLGIDFFYDFIRYQIRLFATEGAGHGGFPLYHPLVLLLGCFPASILLFAALRKHTEDTIHQTLLKRWMTILLCVVLILFSIVKTKIIHYSSLCYFPITFLAAYSLHKIYEKRKQWNVWLSAGLLLLGGLWSTAVFIAVYLLAFGKLDLITPYIKDDFALAALQQPFNVNPNELAIPIIFFALLVVAVLLFHFKKTVPAIATLTVGCAFFALSVMVIAVPRAERISQNAMIEFLKTTSVEKPQYEMRGFKSYAHYFYGKTEPGNTSNTTYVVTKINLLPRIDTTDLTRLYAKNGYIFYRKK